MVPPGQIIRKQMPPEKINSILEFSTMRPRERFANIREGLSVRLGTTSFICSLTVRYQVLEYGQSEYVRQFGMTISDNLINFGARILKPLKLKYNPASRRPVAVRHSLHIWCRDGPIVSLSRNQRNAAGHGTCEFILLRVTS